MEYQFTLSTDLDELSISILVQCEEFNSFALLEDIFKAQPLAAFADRLPRPYGRGLIAKRDVVISVRNFLLETYYADGRVLFLLFLETLCQRYIAQNALHDELHKLHQQVLVRARILEEVAALEKLLIATALSAEAMFLAFQQVAPKLAVDHHPLVVTQALAWLSSDQPDLVLLLKFVWALPLTPSVRQKAEPRLQALAELGNIDFAQVRPDLTAATTTAPVLLVMVEPTPLTSTEEFSVRAWLYQNDIPAPQAVPPPPPPATIYTRATLATLLPQLLGEVRQQCGSMAKKLLVELALPLCLWDWEVNKLPIPLGIKLTKPLAKDYVLALRSWDRLSPLLADYKHCRHEWYAKWQTCLAEHPSSDGDTRVYCQAHAQTDCGELHGTLQKRAGVFVALFPVATMPQHLQDLFSTVLAAGLPVAFWPVQPVADPAQLETAVQKLLSAQDPHHWPQALYEARNANASPWLDVQFLWDNPQRLPPDAGYTFQNF